MKVAIGIAIAVLTGCELTEVAGGVWADGVEEMEDDAADVETLDLDVELDGGGGGG